VTDIGYELVKVVFCRQASFLGGSTKGDLVTWLGTKPGANSLG